MYKVIQTVDEFFDAVLTDKSSLCYTKLNKLLKEKPNQYALLYSEMKKSIKDMVYVNDTKSYVFCYNDGTNGWVAKKGDYKSMLNAFYITCVTFVDNFIANSEKNKIVDGLSVEQRSSFAEYIKNILRFYSTKKNTFVFIMTNNNRPQIGSSVEEFNEIIVTTSLMWQQQIAAKGQRVHD